MNTLAINSSSFTSHNSNLSGSLVGKFISSLFKSNKVAVSVPYIDKGIDSNILSVNEQDVDAHIIVCDTELKTPVGATVIHPILLPKIIGEMLSSDPLESKKAEKLTRAILQYWNFDELDPIYRSIPTVDINVNGKSVCYIDMYAPGCQHDKQNMMDRLKETCQLYNYDGWDTRLIPEIAVARKQMSASNITKFGNFYARTVNTQHSIFETLRLIYFCGQNAVIYYDDGEQRRWWIKEQQKYKGCLPATIMKSYPKDSCNSYTLSNGIVEIVSPIPTNP